jgi:thiamine kinase
MVDSLPRNTRLKLDQTLGQWSHWLCDPPLATAPRIEQRLGGGLSNHSILVATGERRFVIRVDNINPLAHGLNRQIEWRVLQEAARRQLAPVPRYFNPDLGTLVCDYLAADAEQLEDIDDIADLLRNIHSLPAIHSRLNLGERILNYERQVAAKGPQTVVERFHPPVLQRLNKCAQQETANVVCHNDLLRGNRLYSSNQLWALDWEYAAMASPYYELAVIVAGDSLNETERDQLLRRYLQRDATSDEHRRLGEYSCVYRYLELLWYLAVEPTPIAPELVTRKTAELERALGLQPR